MVPTSIETLQFFVHTKICTHTVINQLLLLNIGAKLRESVWILCSTDIQHKEMSMATCKKQKTNKQKNTTANTARYDSDLLTAPCSYFLSNTV